MVFLFILHNTWPSSLAYSLGLAAAFPVVSFSSQENTGCFKNLPILGSYWFVCLFFFKEKIFCVNTQVTSRLLLQAPSMGAESTA
jgi:hypothetical protein